MTKLFACTLALALAVGGTAFAQMPAGLPSAASAKAAADKASAKAAADTAAAKTAADSTGTKAGADATAAKSAAQTNSKAAVAKGEADTATLKTDASGKAKEATAAAKSALDLNTASEAELAALPGVGADNAKKIIDARPFARKDQLVSKKLLTKANYTKVKDLVVAKQPAKK
jgi:competence protein ComEA